MKLTKFFLLFLLTSGAASAQNPPKIVVSINPIYQILLAITEDKNNSILIIDPKVSEHDYQLKKSDAKAVFESDIIFYVDNDLEKNFAKLVRDKTSYQLSQVSNIKLLPRRGNIKKLDLHLWLNPENSVKIAEFMTQKICEIDVPNSKKYQQNLEKFKKEIAKTEKIIHHKFQEIASENFVFYHDGYQYFEDYFDLKPLKVITDGHDHDLTIASTRTFDKLAKSHQIKCLFGDLYDEKNSAQKLAANYQIKFATLDLMGGEGGYSKLLLDIASNVTECLK